MLAVSFSQFDRPCVKTHTSAKCRKHNSPARHRTSRGQYDLTLRDAIARRYFYVWRDRWSFRTAKTQSGLWDRTRSLQELWPRSTFPRQQCQLEIRIIFRHLSTASVSSSRSASTRKICSRSSLSPSMTVTHAAIVEQAPLGSLSPAAREHDRTIALTALNYVKDRLAMRSKERFSRPLPVAGANRKCLSV